MLTARLAARFSCFAADIGERTGVARHFSSTVERFGGADRDRTDDPLLAKQVLSQLSYSPIRRWTWSVRLLKIED